MKAVAHIALRAEKNKIPLTNLNCAKELFQDSFLFSDGSILENASLVKPADILNRLKGTQILAGFIKLDAHSDPNFIYELLDSGKKVPIGGKYSFDGVVDKIIENKNVAVAQYVLNSTDSKYSSFSLSPEQEKKLSKLIVSYGSKEMLTLYALEIQRKPYPSNPQVERKLLCLQKAASLGAGMQDLISDEHPFIIYPDSSDISTLLTMWKNTAAANKAQLRIVFPSIASGAVSKFLIPEEVAAQLTKHLISYPASQLMAHLLWIPSFADTMSDETLTRYIDKIIESDDGYTAAITFVACEDFIEKDQLSQLLNIALDDVSAEGSSFLLKRMKSEKNRRAFTQKLVDHVVENYTDSSQLLRALWASQHTAQGDQIISVLVAEKEFDALYTVLKEKAILSPTSRKKILDCLVSANNPETAVDCMKIKRLTLEEIEPFKKVVLENATPAIARSMKKYGSHWDDLEYSRLVDIILEYGDADDAYDIFTHTTRKMTPEQRKKSLMKIVEGNSIDQVYRILVRGKSLSVNELRVLCAYLATTNKATWGLKILDLFQPTDEHTRHSLITLIAKNRRTSKTCLAKYASAQEQNYLSRSEIEMLKNAS